MVDAGLEDFEYYHLLSELVQAAEKKGASAAYVRALVTAHKKALCATLLGLPFGFLVARAFIKVADVSFIFE